MYPGDTSHAKIAKTRSEEGAQTVISFQYIFAGLRFERDDKTEIRNESRKVANALFVKGPESADLLKHTWVPDVKRIVEKSSAITQSGRPPTNGISVVVPWPSLKDDGTVKTIGPGGRKSTALLRRIDAINGRDLAQKMTDDDYNGYFHKCLGLGTVASSEGEDIHWVWLMREVVTNLYVMCPFSIARQRNVWDLEVEAGGYNLAQRKALDGDALCLPTLESSSEVWESYWAILFNGGIKETPVFYNGRFETPAPRADLTDSEVIDKAVVAFTKMKDAVAGPFTAESRDEPAKDKPSAIAEVAGAVAVAAGVALATGVVAALV